MPTPSNTRGDRPNGAHSISLTSAYGEVLDSEQVGSAELASALRRFYNRAMQRTNTVIVLNGVAHTRNSFLEFVREFNDCSERSNRLHA